jgi:hypothetical protein
MDPLSVAASVVGLMGAAGKMTTLLHSLVTKARHAPVLAKAILTEITAITAALAQLQSYVLGNSEADPTRSSLLFLDQVLTALSGCVITYSELEAIIDSIHISSTSGYFDRMKWSLKESAIFVIVERLQSHKSTLTLMLNVLQWLDHSLSQTLCEFCS